MNYQTAYKKIKDKLSECSFNSETGNFAVQITLTNKDCGGILYIQSRDGQLICEPYDYNDNDANVFLTANDMIKLMEKKMTLKDGLENGKVVIEGSAPTFLSLLDSLTPPETKKMPETKPKEIKKRECKRSNCKNNTEATAAQKTKETIKQKKTASKTADKK